MAKDISITPASSQPTKAAPTSPYYGMYGHYWKSNRDVSPGKWIQESKKLCACDEHQASQWPMEYAVITIPPCAYKCPYCSKFDNLETTNPQVVKLRAHIKKDHLKKKPDDFAGLSVTPGRMTKPRAPKP